MRPGKEKKLSHGKQMAELDFQAWLFPSTSCHQDLVRFGVDKASRAETEWVGRVLVDPPQTASSASLELREQLQTSQAATQRVLTPLTDKLCSVAGR